MKWFSRGFAEKIILLLLTVVAVFHLLVIIGIVPYKIVWGGRLESSEMAKTYEVISFIVSVIMLLIVAMHAGYIKTRVNKNITRIIIGVMCGFFLLGTIGNFLSTNTFEKLFFSPITLTLAVSCFRVCWSKN